jgi:predicted ArsR family transcriptional regulator
MHRALPPEFGERFRVTTRGQIIELLRCKPMTADELARELDLTGKGVRAQLTGLEADGLIRHHSRRRSGKAGKPAVLYEFDPAAEHLFCAGYAPVLIAALDATSGTTSAGERKRHLRKIGKELARAVAHSRERSLPARIASAAKVLEAWGGAPRVERSNGTVVIRSCGCPLSAAVRAHPEACVILETMLSTVLGVPVRERCDRSRNPSCRFELRSPGR